MKALRLLVALLLALGLGPPLAAAQSTLAQTVSACGTPNNTPVVGYSYSVTMDTTGKLCTSASGGGGGGAITAASGSYAAGALSAGSIVDLGTGSSPGANTTNGILKAIDTTLGTPFQAGGALGASSANIGNVNPATHGQCSTLCASDVLKNSAGALYSFEVQADATLSGAAWYVMIFDATSLPADGTVTPAKCYAQPSGTTQMGGTLAAGGATFGTGIVIGVSTTGCYTKTASTHAYIAGDFQ